MNELILEITPQANQISIGKLIELLVQGSFTIISILGAAYLAYSYALKRLKRETPLLLQRELYSKKLNALQDLWKLLQYTTENENKKSILVYEQIKDSPRNWFVVMENAKTFKNEIVNYFYGSGSGIFISKELKELLFEYDRQLYGLLLKESENNGSKVLIKNNKLAERLIEIHDELMDLLKQNIKELPIQIEKEN